MLLRTLSALVLAPLILGLLWWGTPGQFLLLAGFVVTGLQYEWRRLTGVFSWGRDLGWVLASWLFLGSQYLGLASWIPLELMVVLGVAYTAALFRFRPGVSCSAEIALRLSGLVYVTVPLLAAVAIRGRPDGAAWLLFLLFILWGTDTGAYLVGSRFGRNKLVPNLSPGKTREGLAGGLGIGLLAGMGGATAFSLPLGLVEGTLLCLLLAVASQVGDLIESLLKRESGVKDSGNWIPGHGGLLDRLDSLLVAAPVLYAYLLVADLREKGWVILGH
ncbi:MAG: phosphatidate cytidylyltransferase [Magnetococcales bacterium]|nr:phosphatidate cytidylyltransferase [Magnetococcales bacterium]MBF0155961.1 phosphatidate cytidylyltransferase [Magnetococcales bacterium]